MVCFLLLCCFAVFRFLLLFFSALGLIFVLISYSYPFAFVACRIIVIGSANVNDRSMLGSRDTEMALRIEVTENKLLPSFFLPPPSFLLSFSLPFYFLT
jgi:hypothetical protein